MSYDLFLLPLLTSFAISALLLVVLIAVSRKYTLRDLRVSQRHFHLKGISRFGGVAMIVAFVLAILLDQKLVISTPLLGVLFACAVILILGTIDDLRPIPWKVQLFFQLAIVMLVYIMGVQLLYVTNPWGGIFVLAGTFGYAVGLIVSVVWIVFLMNALNWVDGIDGAAGGVTLIGAVAIFLLSLRPEVNQPPVGIIAAALIGALLAFVWLNFYPAKIMAGTSGSMFMGFMLAIMAIFAGAKIATTLLVLTIPIIDALWVIGERLKAGDSIFIADKRHLHFKLREIGWSPIKICLFYYGVTTLVAAIALNTHALGKVVTFISVAMFMLSMLVAIRRKIFFAQKK